MSSLTNIIFFRKPETDLRKFCKFTDVNKTTNCLLVMPFSSAIFKRNRN